MSYIYSENFTTIYINFINEDTINNIIITLNHIYFYNFIMLLLMTYIILLNICNNKKRKDYIMLNTVEPKIIKGEIINTIQFGAHFKCRDNNKKINPYNVYDRCGSDYVQPTI